jgi:hypothetical protein
MPKQMVKRLAVFLGACGLLLAVGGGWIHDALSTQELPTCISFESSGPSDSMDKVMGELVGIARDGGLYSQPDAPMAWTSVRAEMTYTASGVEPVNCRVAVCSKNSDPREWQVVAKRVEDVLLRNTNTVSATMQRSNRDFSCHADCVANLPVPIDFDQLNRTLLVLSGS